MRKLAPPVSRRGVSGGGLPLGGPPAVPLHPRRSSSSKGKKIINAEYFSGGRGERERERRGKNVSPSFTVLTVGSRKTEVEVVSKMCNARSNG